MNIRKYLVTGLFLCCGMQAAFGGWKQVGKFTYPISCGFFWDENHGLIGSGNFTINSDLSIYWTDNGGLSWQQSVTPNGQGRLTSIMMTDKNTGYASLYSDNYAVWQTTDGGKNWTDFTKGNSYPATCIYKTLKAFIKTLWDNNTDPFSNPHLGGISTDGRNYSEIFSGGSGHSNGIAFADDNIGAVTMGPQGQFGNRTTSWFTRDGGLTWSQGEDLNESWGIYASAGTRKFVTLPEGDAMNRNHAVFLSSDGGNSWNQVFDFAAFGNPDFTGHIAGVGNTVYVQTLSSVQGLYRSDDLGATWVNVGGPSNVRDTRFAVTGCRGEVVYAFDDNGGVWKTTDGGDGAFSFTPRVGDIASVKAGELTRIPIFIDSSAAPFSINQFTGNLTLNTDLLEPVGLDTAKTLSNGAVFDTIYQMPDKSFNFQIKYSKPLKNGIPLSVPVVYILAKAFLTMTDTTNVNLNSLSASSGNTQKQLIVCSSTSNIFRLAPECFDSTLRQFMKTGEAPKLFSIVPNPSGSDNITAKIYFPWESDIQVDLVNSYGSYQTYKSYRTYAGVQNIPVNTAGLPSGEYTLRIHLNSGSLLTGHVVIIR